MRRHFILTACAISSLLAATSLSIAEGTYTDAQLSKARAFIDTEMPADKKAMLEDLAKKSGKAIEVMFLDIAELTGDDTLGVSSKKTNIPEPPIIGVDSKKPNQPPPPPPGGTGAK